MNKKCTELEQKFYNTFEIEPEPEYWCKRLDETNIADCNGIKEPSKKCAKCEYGYIRNNFYPKITAEKLLEMICICNSTYINGYTNYFVSTGKTKEELKEEILKKCITLSKDINNQIQQLFKD